MAVQTRAYTVEEFDQFAALPENAERRLEYIGGEIIDVVSNSYSSEVAVNISFFIKLYLRQHGIGGHVTGADGGYMVAGQRFIPDVAFISAAKQPAPSHDPYNPNAPDLAVKVLSPDDVPRVVRFEVASYWAAGTVVWIVNTERKQVELYTPGQPPQQLGIDDTLDGGAVLPGFTLAVRDIFPEETSQEK
jgi:Uma2 family endonuclease